MALESIQKHVYSFESDLWSFGVLMWEAFSYGATPFADMTPIETALAVRDGHRLPRPATCPMPVYSMMLRMWSLQPSARPLPKAVQAELLSTAIALAGLHPSQHAAVEIIDAQPEPPADLGFGPYMQPDVQFAPDDSADAHDGDDSDPYQLPLIGTKPSYSFPRPQDQVADSFV